MTNTDNYKNWKQIIALCHFHFMILSSRFYDKNFKCFYERNVLEISAVPDEKSLFESESTNNRTFIRKPYTKKLPIIEQLRNALQQ